MRTIRVLFVLTSPVRGGVEEVVLSLLQRLPREEFDLALAAPAALLKDFARDLTGLPVTTVAVQAESWRQTDRVRRLSAFMARHRPDVVNPHLFRSTVVAAPLARWHRVPAVIETYHGREGWRRGLVSGSFLPDRLVARCLHRVIAVSQAARDFLVQGKGYPAGKILVVPNGRDLSAYAPGHDRDAVRKELNLDTTTPLAAVVGRLETQKGHRYLVDAWTKVVPELPDARLLIVGEGSLRTALEAQARARGVAGSLIFTGFRPDVPRLLDAVDVVALPSLYEGLPLTAIEAAAMAKPIVATAVDGTPEVVADGTTGVLVPPADPSALARGLLALLGEPEVARRMGIAGRMRALERFDVGRNVDATAQVYRSAVRGSA